MNKKKDKKYIYTYIKKKSKIKNTYIYPYISSEHKEIKLKRSIWTMCIMQKSTLDKT